jgi:hypothetical protein
MRPSKQAIRLVLSVSTRKLAKLSENSRKMALFRLIKYRDTICGPDGICTFCRSYKFFLNRTSYGGNRGGSLLNKNAKRAAESVIQDKT